MPTEVIIQSNEYRNQFINGDTYATDAADITFNLAGVVMERIQYTTTMDVRWYFQASNGKQLEWEDLGSNLYRFKKTAGDFISDGFAVGDTLTYSYVVSGVAYTRNGSVTLIGDPYMYVQFTTSTVFGTTTGTQTEALFQGTSSLTAMIYSFGLIDNAETFNTNSKVSGNNQAFYVGALVVGVPQTMTKQGNYQDWITGSVTCEKQANPSTFVQRYELIHDFILNPFYLDGQLSNLQGNVIPSQFSGLNSLKHVVKADFRTGLSNPNTSKSAELDNILGSTGYFAENMNGFNNLYSIVTTTYENAAANSADGILTTEETTIRIKIAKSTGSFISTDRIGAFVSYLPTATNYTDRITDFEENFIYDNAFCLADGTPVANTGVIDSVEASVNAGDIDLIIKTTYTAAQQGYLAANTDPNFLLAVQVGDVTLTNANSDRVMLIADALPFDTSADIAGLMTLNSWRYFAHDNVVGTDAGWTSFTGWNEDGLRINFDFDLELAKDARLDGLKIQLLATEATTGESFVIDTYEFILGNVISGGVQQFNIVDSRGYTLAVGSQFNDITLTTGALVGTLQNYIGTFSQKLSWQEWIENLDVDSVFYDSLQANDGFNDKTSNYSILTDNYNTSVQLEANVYGTDTVLLVSGNTTYKLGSAGEINTYDYDEDVLSPSPEIVGTISTWTADGVTNLGGAILTNGDNTLVKTTWQNATNAFVATWAYYGIHRIEEENAQGYSIQELSSINTPPTGQIVQPIVGNVLLDMAIVGSDLVTTSLIDGLTMNPNSNYKLSSRLQSPNLKGESGVDRLSFYHYNDTATALTFTLVKSGATAQWDYSDGTAVDTTNSTNHTLPYRVQHYVSAFLDDFDNVTEILAAGDQMKFSFNWTLLNNVTSFEVSNSPDLTAIYSPVTATVMTKYNANLNDITGTLNVSGLSGLGGIFNVQQNANLSGITLPTSAQTFSAFKININPSLGYVDLTTLTNLTESGFCGIDIDNNGLTAAEVNHFLVDLDSMSTGGFSFRSINIGGSNAAPDGSSGGYDGTTAKANLITKTFSVTTS